MVVLRCVMPKTTDDHKRFSIVRGGVCGGSLTPAHDAGQEVERSGAKVANKAEHLQDISAIRPVDPSVHSQTDHKHCDHRYHQQDSAYVAFLNNVSCARNQPTHERRY